jgi:hypothetical protein
MQVVAAAAAASDELGGEGAWAALLEALEAALPARLYLDSLIRLLHAEDAALRRRALRLFAARVAASAEEGEAADEDRCAMLLPSTVHQRPCTVL